MYLAHRAGGWPMQRLLWQAIREDQLLVHRPGDPEAERMADLMEQYRDTPMDLADASIVAAAEALGLSRVFTLDRHFHAYRIGGTRAFDVFPS
jgi:predicted nucleic acid-binding protein